jgi:hypothetical protein
VREYKLAREAGPTRRGGPVAPRPVHEISGDGARVVVLVADSCAIDVVQALNRAYQQGRADAEVLPLGLPAQTVETVVRSAAELWLYNCDGSIMSAMQRHALDDAAEAWYAEHAQAMR